MTISSLTAMDPRGPWEKVSRRQCWRGADKLGIKYPVGATHQQMVDLFMAQGIQPQQVVNFVPVEFDTPHGKETHLYPENKERVYDEAKDQRRQELFEKRLEAAYEADKREKEAKTQLDEQRIAKIETDMSEIRGMLAQLLGQHIKKPKETDPFKMKWLAQKKWCAERGVELKKGEDVKAVITSILEKENGAKDPS